MKARLALCALLLAAHEALAQGATPPTAASRQPSALVRYGKWGAAALFVAFTATGAAVHEEANTDYDKLTAFCRDVGPCDVGTDGRYVNPAPEALYQDVVQGDRAARAWLIGGQVALAGAVTLFILELKERKAPRDIPFAPYVAGGSGAMRVGVRLPL